MKHLYREVFRLLAGLLTGRRKADVPVVVTNTETVRRQQVEKQAARPGGNDLLIRVEAFLCREYDFRFNSLTEATEFRLRSQPGDFTPLGKRELNDLCITVREQGIDCWDRDVSRYVHSSRIQPYHPFRLWMSEFPEWDGMDRIRPLAERVSTNGLWINGFRRWLLGLTAQWIGMNDLHGNSVVPVLISRRQGQHKSTFCKLLLPDALQPYYTDHYDLTTLGAAVQKLSSFGLINLDEFDKYGEKKMTMLKNLLQMPAVSIRKPYEKGYTQLPRIASFIATSNRADLLTDPTGSRRFLCIEVEEKIDTSPIDHEQLFAQLRSELSSGERYWFTADEESAITRHNQAYEKAGMDTDAFHSLYRIPEKGEEEGEWLSGAQLYENLREAHPAVMREVTTTKFGRTLIALGVERKHTRFGNMYRVIRIKRGDS